MRTQALLFAALGIACHSDHHHAPPGDAGTTPTPHACAGALDRSAPTDFYDAVRCLFEGPDAPQQAVTAVFDRERIAVVRGRLLDDTGAPLAGADVTVPSHPDYGHTLTRDDGTFDLAVNGGELVTLRFTSDGTISSQRHAATQWRRFAVLGDVTLRALATPTAVTLATTGTIADGATSSDASGARASALYFAPNTTATIDTPNGPQTLSTFHLHATEFTVGDRGPSAMPGDLPATSAYTYAIDFTVDEAVAAGAKHVTFDPPAIHYVDNFLHFATGTTVPNGYFDADRDQWLAAANGTVIQIVAVDAAGAAIDLDGDGVADGDAALAAAGITAAERAAIGQRYAAGKSLWRMPIPHFTSYDHNLAGALPSDALQPYDASSSGDTPNDCKTTTAGSIIGCDDQSLGEALPIPGTTLALHYQSERSAGRLGDNQIAIQVAGPTLPASLQRIDVEVEVLGTLTRKSFDPVPNTVWQFAWDGTDAYGRAWQGRQLVHIRVGYVYNAQYAITVTWASPAQGPIVGDPTRQQLTLWKEWDDRIGKLDATGAGLGGWTIDAVHTLDASGGELALGDGHTRLAEKLGGAVARVAGTGTLGSTGDGGPATAAEINQPHGIAIAADGSVMFSEDQTSQIRRIAPDGTISTIAGTGTSGFSGDGGPATAAQLDRPLGLALAPDGTLYVVDGNNGRVRAISPQGIISTIAGGGQLAADGTTGDGGPATAAYLPSPHAIALGRDGSLYITDNQRGEVRRVAPDGTISTIAGGGTGSGNEGDPATSVALLDPLGIAVGVNSELYVTEWSNNRVRRIDPSGAITTVIGLSTGTNDDGSLAAAATIIEPHTVDVGADGSLYVTEEGMSRVREITPSGLVFTIAGGGSYATDGDNVAPRAAQFLVPRVVYAHKDGSLWIADWADNRIRKIRPSFPGFLHGETMVGSQAGTEVYVFDDHGRHLRTIDTMTGAVRLTASYDGHGLVSALTDRDGAVLTIERDANGAPTALVSRFGVRTQLSLDADGNLATVAGPDGATATLGYGAGGLLASLTEPRGDVHRFTYDATGRLVSDAHPSGLTKTLAADATGVTTTLAGGATTHVTVNAAGGSATRTFRDPAGLISTFASTPGGAKVITPTETVTATYAADPRFGMQTPFASSITIDRDGLELAMTHTRSVTMTDVANPLTLVSQVDVTTVNSHVTTETWDGPSHTLTRLSPEGRTTVTTFDTAGRVVATQRGSLAPMTFGYDSAGRVATLSRGGRIAARTFDASGNITASTAPNGDMFAAAHDPLGRPTTLTRPDGAMISVAYDANGNVTQLAAPNATHAITYGPGNLALAYSGPGISSHQSYDAAGRVTSHVAADGTTTALGYDAAGRISTVQYGSDARQLSYDTTTGQLAAIASSTEQLALGYSGPLPTETFWSGTVFGDVERTYDNDFAVSSELVFGTSMGTIVSYAHDGDGLLTQAGDLQITADANGQLSFLSLVNLNANVSHDSFGDPSHYAEAGPTGALYDLSVTRDAVGRIAERTETIAGATHVDAFRYDALGHLIAQTRDGAAAGAWTWDAAGNRTSNGASYDASGRLVALGTATLSYDANGALVRRTIGTQATAYGYDAAGALRSVTLPDGTAITYTLDPVGRRIAKARGGVRVAAYLYRDEFHPVAVLDATGTVAEQFVYATRRDVPDYMLRGGSVYRLVSDLRGSVRLVVDASTGAIAQQLDYDAFGAVIADSNPGFQPFGFSGGLYDADTGLVHFGARDYDPAAGRFITMDPSGLAGGLAPYLYANGDPINYVDPDGHFAELVGGFVIGAFVGGVESIADQLKHGGCINWGEVGTGALKGGVEGVLLSLVPLALPSLLPAAAETLFGADAFAESEWVLEDLSELGESAGQLFELGDTLHDAFSLYGAMGEIAGYGLSQSLAGHR